MDVNANKKIMVVSMQSRRKSANSYCVKVMVQT